jgi:hypothetical protein
MVGLERLRWLVWYNNINGLMPIRMEVNRTTKKFECLVWSYGHPITWWFICLAVVQIALMIWTTMKFVSYYPTMLANDSSVTIFSVALLSVSYIIGYCSPRLILLHFKNLAEATTYMRKFDDCIVQYGQWSCTSKKRIVGGLFLISISVSRTKLMLLKQFVKFDLILDC